MMKPFTPKEEDAPVEEPPVKEPAAVPAAAAPEREDEEDGGEEDGDDDGADALSPEERSMYETILTAALAQLYESEQAQDAIIKKLKNERSLPFGIGHTAAMLVLSLRGGAEKQGKTIPESVMFAVGQEVIGELVEMALAAKLTTEEKQEEVATEALMEGMKAFGEAELAAGRVSPERMVKAGEDFRKYSGAKPPEQGPVAAAKQSAKDAPAGAKGA